MKIQTCRLFRGIKEQKFMPVVNYAHRGASEYYPENTLWSFYAGMEMGADGIETDIQRTKDGVLVLHHDDTLERVAGKIGSIRDYTYEQLLEMDFGVFKGERFAGEKIVTLDTFLTHFGQRNLTLALEIKQSGVEKETLDCLARHSCSAKVTVTSFLWDSVQTIRALDDRIDVGYLTEAITVEKLDVLEKNRIGQICPRVDLVQPKDMELARGRGFAVRFWGIKNVELMERALELNGDGMTVNFPDRLTAALQK